MRHLVIQVVTGLVLSLGAVVLLYVGFSDVPAAVKSWMWDFINHVPGAVAALAAFEAWLISHTGAIRRQLDEGYAADESARHLEMCSHLGFLTPIVAFGMAGAVLWTSALHRLDPMNGALAFGFALPVAVASAVAAEMPSPLRDAIARKRAAAERDRLHLILDSWPVRSLTRRHYLMAFVVMPLAGTGLLAATAGIVDRGSLAPTFLDFWVLCLAVLVGASAVLVACSWMTLTARVDSLIAAWFVCVPAMVISSFLMGYLAICFAYGTGNLGLKVAATALSCAISIGCLASLARPRIRDRWVGPRVVASVIVRRQTLRALNRQAARAQPPSDSSIRGQVETV